MSKAAKIRLLLEAGKRPREISVEVGCHEGYVQAVKQRIIYGSLRPADRAWVADNPEKMRARWRANTRRRTLKKQQQRLEAQSQ